MEHQICMYRLHLQMIRSYLLASVLLQTALPYGLHIELSLCVGTAPNHSHQMLGTAPNHSHQMLSKWAQACITDHC